MPRLRMKALGSGRWIIVACAILALASGVTAFAFTFPLFLAMRERRMRALAAETHSDPIDPAP